MAGSEHPDFGSAGAPARILLAEDDDDTREMLRRIFLLRGWTVVAVSDGEEALAVWRQECFDLVILDLGMPAMSGDDVAKKIRATEAGGADAPETPILALSASVRKEEKQKCLQAGMNEFLAKPIRVADLYAAVIRHLSARNLSRSPVSHRQADAQQANPPKTSLFF